VCGSRYAPQFPVSVTFGGKNGDVMYIVGGKQVWSIQTKVETLPAPRRPQIARAILRKSEPSFPLGD
jgi:hypothetical protein